MPVQFNAIPDGGTLRVPLFYAELNAAQTPYQSISRLGLIGQMLATGSATPNVPVQVTGNEDALFGQGSMLAAMCKIARRNAPFQEIWALPVADDDAGTAAAGSIKVESGPPQSGTLTVYIAGRRVRIGVTTADNATAVATRLAGAINANADLPVTATVNSDTVTVTARHKGVQGNFIRIETDYYGDEGPLAAEMLTITPMANGSGDPKIDDVLAAMGDDEFDWLAGPYTDATNLGYIDALLNGVSGRWSPYHQLYGHYITAKEDTQANLSSFGNGLNSPWTSVMGYYQSPTPPWEWAAALAAVCAAHLSSAPELSRPLHTLELLGVLPPKNRMARFDRQQRNSLLFDGISTYYVDSAGQVRIERVITTYQKNVWGDPDASWLDIETRAQAVYAIRYLRAKVTGTWGRAALRDDNPFGVMGVATPADIRDTIVHGYRELSALNVVENEDLFEQLLVVERNAIDANRVDVYLPADHVNQLRIIAVNATSFLQYPSQV